MPSLFVFHWISCVSLLTAGDIFCLRCQCLCQCCSAFFATCPLWSLWLFCPGAVAKGQKSQRLRSGDVAKILWCCMKSWVFEGRRISRFFFFQLLMISRCKLCMVESWPQMLTFLCDLPVNFANSASRQNPNLGFCPKAVFPEFADFSVEMCFIRSLHTFTASAPVIKFHWMSCVSLLIASIHGQ